MRTGRKVILPVWHGVNDNEVAKYSPILADNFALKTQEGVPKVTLFIIVKASFGSMGKVEIEVLPQIGHLLLGTLGLSK